MDSVAQTAYYCCGVRAKDAASASPICNDQLAQRFMTDEGRAAFERFSGLTTPNASNATRARIIDDLLRERIKADPRQKIVLVGAGFDTRAYRLEGGDWTELDQGELLARKTVLLPIAECPAPLTRIAIDFTKESLADKLAPMAGTANVIVVVEGVLMYLTEEQKRSLFSTLRQTFPGVTLICDLMNRTFAEKYAMAFRQVLRTLGTDFTPQKADPGRTIEEEGFAEVRRISIVGRARELGVIRIPGLLFHTLLRGLRDGYGIHVFRAKG